MAVPVSKWRKILEGVAGHQVAGKLRVSTAELLALVGAENLEGKARLEASLQLRSIMLDLGWTGPATMRIGSETVRGYRRADPDCALEEPSEQQPAADDPAPEAADPVPVTKSQSPSPEELAKKLENVCRLSLDKIEEILKLPTDSRNGNVLRAQTACAASAIQCQLRADETRLKVRRNNDVLERFAKLIREAKKRIPKGSTLPEITGAAEATHLANPHEELARNSPR
jgi:hypothetical protein